MKVSALQYEVDLKQQLLDLGYKLRGSELFTDIDNNYICTNAGTTHKEFSILSDSFKNYANRIYINYYNPELFLAIAAMTKGREWIVGEYLAYKQELFKVKSITSNINDRSQGLTNLNCGSYRKPELEEIIEKLSYEERVGIHVNNDNTLDELHKLCNNIIVEKEMLKYELNTIVEVINGGNGCFTANGAYGRICTREEAINHHNYKGQYKEVNAELYVINQKNAYGLCKGYKIKILSE
jgi:hypothetical protein